MCTSILHRSIDSFSIDRFDRNRIRSGSHANCRPESIRARARFQSTSAFGITFFHLSSSRSSTTDHSSNLIRRSLNFFFARLRHTIDYWTVQSIYSFIWLAGPLWKFERNLLQCVFFSASLSLYYYCCCFISLLSSPTWFCELTHFSYWCFSALHFFTIFYTINS